MANPRSLLANFLILLGITLILVIIFLTQYPKYLAQVKNQPVYLTKKTNNTVSPKYLELIGVSGKLPIVNGNFNDGRWDLVKDQAIYLEGSGIPNQPGNIVIYGHNTKQVLANLEKLKTGDKIILFLDDNTALNFRVNKKYSVNPTDVKILEQTSNQTITLFTCNGLLDSTRLVVTGIRITALLI